MAAIALVGALTASASAAAEADLSPDDATEAPANSDPAKSDQRDDDPHYSSSYTGAFVEYSVRAGASLATDAAYDGWNVDIGARQAFPMMLGDVRLAYRFDKLAPGDAAAGGPVEQHGLGAYLAIHPLYLAMLGSDWLSYTISSLYAEVGGGARVSMLERPDADDYQTSFGPFVSVGAGLDVPLSDPDVGYAPWLNILYRWQVADFDGALEGADIDMHVLQVGIGWRINGLLF